MSRAKWKNVFKEETLKSTFLSNEKDLETICNRLFIDGKKFSDELKRLLVIQSSDCLDNLTNTVYLDTLKKTTVASLKKDGYLKIVPLLKFKENETVKSYIIITMDNYLPCQDNPYWRDCDIMIDIVCNYDYWDLGQFRLRPYKIAGYIDALLNDTKLTGIGTLRFSSCNELILDENFGGLCLVYHAVHGVDDEIPFPELENEDR